MGNIFLQLPMQQMLLFTSLTAIDAFSWCWLNSCINFEGGITRNNLNYQSLDSTLERKHQASSNNCEL